jgi:DNA polymerase III delta prime subunit
MNQIISATPSSFIRTIPPTSHSDAKQSVPLFSNINEILERKNIIVQIKHILNSFDTNCNDITFKRGIYIYGSPGCGKTEFVMNLLKELDYDIIKYDAGDVRNKLLIDTLTSNNISNCNVLQRMKGITKKIAIVMDEIDGMNNGDKGGITSLIKLIRQKKTKKQRLENKTLNPIICIGNYYIDKKIKELMKVCNTFELKTPNQNQMNILLNQMIPSINSSIMSSSNDDKNNLKQIILDYIQGDLRKLNFIINLHTKKPELLTEETIQNIFHVKTFNEDAKKITQTLIDRPIPIKNHNTVMNETDRTIVALLWHENIIDTLYKIKKNKSFPLYYKILENICFADYTDRITFQKQIWQFNEMSSLIKTFHNNKIYHDTFPNQSNKINLEEIRFTKVLTKYSTEYNNLIFIYNLCQELDMDKKDLTAFFQELRLLYGKEFYMVPEIINQVEKKFENYSINKLDIKRMYRYLDKNVKKDSTIIDEDEEEENYMDI